jgi:hypothetical protein
MLWFNLIGYNGSCWQTYGPIGSYQAFGPDDIFFFASELNSRIETDEDVVTDIDKNPVPYMMLVSGSAFPQTIFRSEPVIYHQASFYAQMPDMETMKKKFKIEYSDKVYRLQLKRWGGPPHFSTAYYDEREKLMLLGAMTDRGYAALVNALKPFYTSVPDDPYIRVTLPMVTLSGKILKKEIKLDPYEELFYSPPAPDQQKHTDKLNHLISLALPYINEGREPDIEAIAKLSGFDTDTAKDILGQVTNSMRTMQQRMGE